MLIELKDLKELIGVPHQTVDGYLVCYKKNKEALFSFLNTNGFFDFHCTNSGWVVGVHQVVAFCSYGYKALANGFTAKYGEIEVHHINNNPLSNEPDNLVYLSCADHQVVSMASKTPFYEKPSNKRIATPFNKRGKKVFGHNRFLANIISLTISFIAKLNDKKTWTIFLEAISFVTDFNIVKMAKQELKKVFNKYWNWSYDLSMNLNNF
jgi:hypothetical protein